MTTATECRAEQELAYHIWWMSDQVPGCSMGGDDPNVINNAEELGLAAFLEGWGCGEGSTIDGAVTPLVEALKQITKGEGRFSEDHLTHCENTVEDMKKLAREAVAAAEEATR